MSHKDSYALIIPFTPNIFRLKKWPENESVVNFSPSLRLKMIFLYRNHKGGFLVTKLIFEKDDL